MPDADFDIIINYSGDPKYQPAFTAAVARWTQIIVADIPDYFSSQYGLIDDLVIDARIAAIDGAGSILGQAGPDVLRSGSRLPAHGEMEFDSADVEQMFTSGIWTGVILHEMGHILGVGTLWDLKNLKNGQGDYIGTYGLAEYRLLSGNAGATSVPVEHDGGSGTAGAHWDEARFDAELMTGYAEAGGVRMPISRMTIGSLQDLGYTVNYAAADAFALPGVTPSTPPPSSTPSAPSSATQTGDNGSNTLFGTAASDILRGLGGNDTLYGFGGDDTLEGGTGNDALDGGAGIDVAVFSGVLGAYLPTDYGSRITVVGPDGSDTLFGVEQLRFTDGTVSLDDGSFLFDTLFYDRNNLDVFHAGVSARGHYETSGWREGRDPNDFFSTSGYLAANRDVLGTGTNPLQHYEQTGWREGRDPSADFDVRLYLLHNPDVAAAGVEPLGHFLRSGRAEGRAAYEAIGNVISGFDAQYYLFHNPDIAAAGVDPLSHFNSYGWREGRNPNAYFDTAGYLSHYQDVAAGGTNPLQHYNNFGWREGRDPSAHFDTGSYLNAYQDIAAAGINPMQHFLQYGIYEGRSAFGDGMWG